MFWLFNGAIAEKFDVSFYWKSKMAAVKNKTETAITFKQLEITTRFQLPPDICDQAQLGYDTVDIARYSTFSDVGRLPNSKMVASESGNGK